MPRTMYQTCEKIMERVKWAGYETQVAWPELADAIRRVAGSNPVTLKAYRKELQACGFLKSSNNLIFEIQKREQDEE